MCFVGLAVTYDTNINLPQVLGERRGGGGSGRSGGRGRVCGGEGIITLF